MFRRFPEAAAKYLILIHSNAQFLERWEGLTDAQREEFGRGHLALTDELADPALANRVTVRDGQTMTTHGPFAEAKEHLAGSTSSSARRLPAGADRRAGSRRRAPSPTQGSTPWTSRKASGPRA